MDEEAEKPDVSTDSVDTEPKQEPDTPKPTPPKGKEPAEKTFTQAEVDAIIAKRLARAKDGDKTADIDIDDLKAKADKADKLEAEIAAIKAENARAKAVHAAAEQTGVPAELLDRIPISEEDLTALAKELADWAKATASATPPSSIAPASADPQSQASHLWVNDLLGLA